MLWRAYVGTILLIGRGFGGTIGPVYFYRKQIRRVTRFIARSAWCPVRKAIFASILIVPMFCLAQLTPAQLTKQGEDHERRLRRVEENYRDINQILTGRNGLQDQIEELTADHKKVTIDVADIKSKIANTLTLITVIIGILGALATWGRIAWQSLKAAARQGTGEQPHV